MTPLRLQDALVNELKTIFEGKYLKNEDGAVSPFLICPQWLPPTDPNVTDQADITYFPYIRVIIDDGQDINEEDPNSCNVRLEIGVNDEDTKYQGHRDLMNAIGTIYNHFMRHKYVGPFEIVYPFKWSLNPENTFPKFYAMVEMVWNLPKVTIVDPLS